MGKENDLLEAARTGNVVTIGKLLSSRGKNVLSQALSFRRAVGPNCQDTSGYTPLHHAVLNGYRDAVQMLLKYDASPTIADNRGSNPLHLAAWTGNVEIVQTLLTVGVSKDQVNVQNNYCDTPLHFAAQYGHTEVVSILLEHGADPTLRNQKEEGPLDLAAQYGRLDTVQLLVRLRPELLAKIPDSRSLLHLAAKNGHHRIVKLLLDAGCNINKKTKTGTALHEAAVFGKIDVVHVLLEHRPAIDTKIEDSHCETALQKIESHSSKVSQDISRMIMAHIRGEPLPVPSEATPPLLLADRDSHGSQEHLSHGHSPDSSPAVRPNPGLVAPGFEIIDHHNIYDNVPDSRSSSYRHHYHPHSDDSGSSPSNARKREQGKPHRMQLDAGSDEVYVNVNVSQIPASIVAQRQVPPRKPQRNSIGILLDQVYNGNSPGPERRGLDEQPQKQQRSASPVHLDVKPPQYGYTTNTMSSQESDSPPPLPDRNYYDVEQAGEYTQLRMDALPPHKQHLHKDKEYPATQPDYKQHLHKDKEYPATQPDYKQQLNRDRDYATTQPDYDVMHEGVSNTSTDSSDNTNSSLYETLSNAQSGALTPDSPYPPYPMGSKPPLPGAAPIQLHIHEPDDESDINTTCEGEYHLDHDDDNDLDAYELLSEAVTGVNPPKSRPKPKPRITPTTSSASSVPSSDSMSPSHKPKPLPRRHKPIPAKRSPGSMSSQTSTPSDELGSSVTSSDQWGGPRDRSPTPDMPPPSPHTAMMGIRAKLNASESSSDAITPAALHGS